MSNKNLWTQPLRPPPPLFVGQAERNFVKQLNDEVIERVVGQQLIYFPIDQDRTDYHSLYGEALNKTFLSPVHVYALVEYEDTQRTQDRFGFDRILTLKVHFHKRRISQDQNLFVRLGDFLQYDDTYFEIVDVAQPRLIFGQDSGFTDWSVLGVEAACRQVRQGMFDPGNRIGSRSEQNKR